jgi:hypothetical protein
MSKSEPLFSNEKRETLRKERYFTSTHRYFLEAKVAQNGTKYIVVDQRRQVEGSYVGVKLRIFEDELLEFGRVLQKLSQIAFNTEQPSASLQEQREIIYKERYSTSTHHYFFEVKVAQNGTKYIVVDQRKKVGDDYVSAKMRIFEDELLEFQRVLQKLARFALNEEQSVEPNLQPSKSESKPSDSDLSPAFFEKLRSTAGWQEFEEYTHYLLKLLGIQTIYKFSGDEQAGKADGFFKFGNLAVIYDCTLDAQNLEERKREQINNYCNRLKQGSIEISKYNTEEFYNYDKQVWIITRGKTRSIKVINNIEVKEIAIQDIMDAYQERLKTTLSNQAFEMKLKNL